MTTDHRRTRWRVLVLLIAVLGALALASCGSDGSDGGSGSSDGGGKDVTIRISSQDFSEQKTLAQVYGQYLEAQGFDVDIQEPIGTRDQIFAALESGDLDLQLERYNDCSEYDYRELRKLFDKRGGNDPDVSTGLEPGGSNRK